MRDADRVQVKIVKHSAFVFNGRKREFQPLCDQTSHNFEWRVSLRLNGNVVIYFA